MKNEFDQAWYEDYMKKYGQAFDDPRYVVDQVKLARCQEDANKIAHSIKPRHKYNAKPQDIDGLHFDSKKEARYYEELKLRVAAGEVLFFLCQVPFHLPGGIKYSLDFMEFHADGSVHCVDVKGKRTAMYVTKKKLVEALFPVKVEEV